MKNKKIIVIFIIILLFVIGFCGFIFQKVREKINFSEDNKKIFNQINYIEQKISPYSLHKEFFESDFYPSYDSAILSWKESYILDAYLDLYQITNKKIYLEKFENRTNGILEATKKYTKEKLLSSRYSENLIKNGSFENTEDVIDKNFKTVQQVAPPIFTDCNDNILIDFGSRALEFLNKKGLSISFTDSESHPLYLMKFWFKAPSGSKIKVSLDNTPLSEFQTTNNEWTIFTSDFEINQSYQNQHTIIIEGSKDMLIDLVSVQSYSEHSAHYGMILKTLLRGITLGAKIDKNITQNWLDEMNKLYDPDLKFYVFSKEGPNEEKKRTILNVAATLGTANIYASQIFNNPNYEQIAVDIAAGFKNTITIKDNNIIWPYSGYFENSSAIIVEKDNIEDISHGNLDIDFIIRAYENNIIFTKDDVMNLANIFIKNLWNGDMENPLFHKLVNGEEEIYNRILTIWHLTELSRFNPEINDIAKNYYFSQWERNKCLVDKYEMDQRNIIALTKILLKSH
ncbi:MAG: hypothetical protein PHE59_00675 [Patescibacteria group bacterium]|nr:hypothetical protein [Patescibacteria group bacterium]MDD5164182.1 hypothetical protein [Patescibacteria group bacterium]MDD5534484.1 hypothetical protein [Patescibacteria group bacterium]